MLDDIRIKIKKIDLFILGLILINVVQSILTPIAEDEAYYWMFSTHLDFGYFDHPPMVAFIIKLSSFLFSGTLSIRFITIVLLAVTTKLMWNLIPIENKTHKYSELVFITIILSIPVLNIYGFITTPDAPLLCFSTVFILTLNNILKKETFVNILALAVAAALLIYSKYHGGIVILLAVLFNPTLLKKKGIYISGIIAVILISPHIYWQFQNNFVTFDYHLFRRSSNEFNIENLSQYFLSVFGILNPVLLILFFLYLRKKSAFRRENKFLIRMFFGFLAFFFFYSFKSRIEAHWIAFSAVPFTILIYNLSICDSFIRRKLKYILITSLILIFSLRLLLILDIPIETEFHEEKKDYFQAISTLANGKKVVFVNSYQKASKYHFYMGEESFSDNNVYYRKNHYDLLNSEKLFNNSQVLLIGNWPSPFFDSLQVKSDKFILYKVIDNYPIFNKLEAKINEEDFHILSKKGEMNLTIYNPYSYDIDLQQENLPYDIRFCLIKGKERLFIPLQIDNIKKLKSNTDNAISVSWNINDWLLQGEYEFCIVMNAGYLYPKVISKNYSIVIE